MASLRHRGPDACSHKSWDDATLVHTRLKIVDLSATGDQPMPGSRAGVWVVFNGEIYNHRALRRELEARGYVFRGQSDTEVIPYLYEEYGSGFVEHLRGMFAIAVLDLDRRRIVLARDRFGIKPLYFAHTGDRLFFASELNALRRFPGIDLRPDTQAIHDYVSLLFVPAPSTLFRGIRALEPGQTLEAQLERDGVTVSIRQYHRWSVAPDPDITLDGASREASSAIDAAVGSQLESDVPLGALLSGGIDSSLMVAAAVASRGPDLHTFNVRFPDPKYDETPAALAVATALQTRHETLEFEDADRGWDHVVGLLDAVGQPFGDTSLFAVNAVSGLMRKNVTVALSGDGGDEAFGGYQLFQRLRPYAMSAQIPSAPRRALLSSAVGVSRGLAARGIGPSHLPQRLEDVAAVSDDAAFLESQLAWIRPAELATAWVGGHVEPVGRWFERRWDHALPATGDSVERLSALATEVCCRLRMPNDHLVKVDIGSMRASLEVRVPFLDEDLFALGLSLPHRMKVRWGKAKRVLRTVAQTRLPDEVARAPKHGFAVPIDVWLDAGFKARLRAELLGGDNTLAAFVAPSWYVPLVSAFCDDRPVAGVSRAGLYQRVFMLLSLWRSLQRATV